MRVAGAGVAAGALAGLAVVAVGARLAAPAAAGVRPPAAHRVGQHPDRQHQVLVGGCGAAGYPEPHDRHARLRRQRPERLRLRPRRVAGRTGRGCAGARLPALRPGPVDRRHRVRLLRRRLPEGHAAGAPRGPRCCTWPAAGSWCCPSAPTSRSAGISGATEAVFAACTIRHVLDRGDEIRRHVDRLCASADLVIRTLQVGYLPRHDAFWSHGLAVDTERWSPGPARRHGAEVVVVHAPNHRQLKGTDAVIAAVERAAASEGHDVRLELLEGRPNEEVRATVRSADIAVDQLLTGYGLFAVEAMAAGLPVISNLRWMPAWMRSAPSLAARAAHRRRRDRRRGSPARARGRPRAASAAARDEPRLRARLPLLRGERPRLGRDLRARVARNAAAARPRPAQRWGSARR